MKENEWMRGSIVLETLKPITSVQYLRGVVGPAKKK